MNKRNFLIVCLLGILLVFAVSLVSCDDGTLPKAEDAAKYPGAATPAVGDEGNIHLWIQGKPFEKYN